MIYAVLGAAAHALLLRYVWLSEMAVLVAIPFEEFYWAAHLCFHLSMEAEIIQIV